MTTKDTGGSARLAAAMLEAANGGRGALDGWLETVTEAEIREAVLALANSRTDRDWLAAKAMQGMLANPYYAQQIDSSECSGDVGKAAYYHADSMLAARTPEAQ